MLTTVRRKLLRPVLAGALMVTILSLSVPVAMALPGDGDHPLPHPPVPTPVPPPTYMPDLVVESYKNGSYLIGDTRIYYIDARIRNQGNAYSDGFWARNEAGLFTGRWEYVTSLPAGSFVDVRYIRTTCEASGTIIADYQKEVREQSEVNNQRNWVVVC